MPSSRAAVPTIRTRTLDLDPGILQSSPQLVVVSDYGRYWDKQLHSPARPSLPPGSPSCAAKDCNMFVQSGRASPGHAEGGHDGMSAIFGYPTSVTAATPEVGCDDK